MTDIQQGVPNWNQRFTEPSSGLVTQVWRQFLVNLWLRTGGGGGGGGGTFNQNTDFNIPAVIGSVARNLVERFYDILSIKDFGAVMDGVTDDTVAWNNAIAAVNAGMISAIFIPPGISVIGGDTIQATKPYDLYGVGEQSRIRVVPGSGTSIIFDIDGMGTNDQVHFRDFFMEATGTGADISRQMMRFAWAPGTVELQNRLMVTNVQARKGFKYGIETVNCVGGRFTNVIIIGNGHTTGVEWAWKSTGSAGAYSIDMVWTACTVENMKTGWYGRGHLEGFHWINPVAAFNDTNWDIVCSGTPAQCPSFRIMGGQMEYYVQGVYFEYCAYVEIIGLEMYSAGGATPGGASITLKNCYTFILDDDIHVNIGTAASDVFVINACTMGKILNSEIVGLRGIGVYLAAGTSWVETDGIKYISPTSSNYYIDDSGLGLNASRLGYNSRRNQQVVGPVVDNSYTINPGVPIGVGTTPTSMGTIIMPVQIGDRLTFSFYINATAASFNTFMYVRVRETQHAPSRPIPYQIIQIGGNRRDITNTRPIGTPDFPECIYAMSVDADVIASADDAHFSLDVWVSAGSITVNEAQLRVARN